MNHYAEDIMASLTIRETGTTGAVGQTTATFTDDYSTRTVVNTGYTGPINHPIGVHSYAYISQRLKSTNVDFVFVDPRFAGRNVFPPVTWKTQWTGRNTYPFNAYLSRISTSLALPTGVSAKALSRLEGLDVNLATFLGEGKESWAMLVDASSRIARAGRFIRRGEYRKVLSALRLPPDESLVRAFSRLPRSLRTGSTALANYWLEFSYGWKPLISDLYGSVSAFRHGIVEKGRLFTIRSSSTNKSSETLFLPFKTGVNQGNRMTWQRSTKVSYGFRAVVHSPITATLQELGLLNPLSLAWELLPYSFIVDWFLPVGNYLSAFSASLGYTLSDGWTSTSIHNTMNGISYGAPVEQEYRSYTRTPWTASVSINLGAIRPEFSLSEGQYLNSLALLRQTFYR